MTYNDFMIESVLPLTEIVSDALCTCVCMIKIALLYMDDVLDGFNSNSRG